MLRSSLLFWLLLCVIPRTSSFAQVVDPDFDPQVYAHGRVYAVAAQNDGKIVVSGRFIRFNGVAASRMVRLEPDGTIDNTFSIGAGPQGGLISKMAIQADGKILVFGGFTSFNDQPHKFAVRLFTDGSVDNSFTLASYFTEGTSSLTTPLLLLADGSVITGRIIAEGGTHYTEMIKINPDGSHDNTFTARIKGIVNDIERWLDGKIIVAGSFTECNDTAAGSVVRLNPDGSIDDTFGTGANSWIGHVLVQSTNKIILAGEFTSFNGVSKTGTIRLNTDGTVDTGFAGTGTRIDAFILDDDDNIYAGRPDIGHILKMNTDGGYVKQFNTLAGQHLILQSDGKLVGMGYAQPSDQVSVRLNTDFTEDNTFKITTGPHNTGLIQNMTTQEDGKILMVGDFVTFGGYDRSGIVRLNEDLTVDETFLTGTGFGITYNNLSFDFVTCQSDGKIVVAGRLDSYNGTARSGNMVRLNDDGTLDDSFSSSKPPFITSMGMFSDALYIGSEINSPYLSRFHSHGTRDDTFAPAINGDVYNCVVQTDGDILIRGNFTTVNGAAVPKLVRLHANGLLDDSFNYTAGSGNVTTVHVYGTDKILLGGSLVSPVDPQQKVSLVMLDMNGVVRKDFLAPATADLGTPDGAFALHDNSLLVLSGGQLIRILPSGKPDPGFNAISLEGYQYPEVLPLTPSSFLYSVRHPASGIRIFHITVTPIPDPPLAPSLVSITPDLSGFAILSWQDNAADETQFVIERAGEDGIFEMVGTVPANTTTYRDNGLESNQVYSYRVAAFNDYGSSYSSEEIFETGIITGTDEVPAEKVSPNPSTGLFQVSFQHEASRTLRIVSMSGKMIGELNTSGDEVAVDLSGEPVGIYCIQILQGSLFRNIKVVKY